MPADKIEEKLNELESKLQDIEADVGKKIKEKDTLKTDIADLKKIVTEVNQVANAYNKAYQSFEKDKNEIEIYANTKKTMIEAAITDENKKKTIDDEVAEVDDEINKKKSEIEKLLTNFEDAKSEFEDAKTELESKQKEYDYLMSYQKKIEGEIKEFKNLKGLIEKEDESNNWANMYFLIKELKKSSEKFSIKRQDELKTALYKAWENLDAEKLDCRSKEEQMKAAKKKIDEEQKSYESLNISRTKRILEKIKEL